MTNIIASASTGGQIPDGRKLKKPMHVIYQCSEDGVGDTIKPRLLAAGADCSKVAFLEEEKDWLTLNDEKIRRAIADFNTKLLVIDPVQAYLGERICPMRPECGRCYVNWQTGRRYMIVQLCLSDT
jgi:hypothetical protein